MRFRLTKTAKILLAVIVVALVGGGIFFGLKSGFITNDTKDVAHNIKESVTGNDDGHKVDSQAAEEYAAGDSDAVITMDKETSDTINLSLDEWIG